MKRLALWLVGALLLVGVSLWLYPPAAGLLPTGVAKWLPLREPATGARAPEKRKGPPPAPVTVATVQVGDMPVIITAPGTVEADASVAIRTRVDGQIAEVLFKDGDLVEKDQILFRLDDRLVRSQILQAEANIRRDEASLAEARATYERRSSLVQKRIVSEAAMDTARTTVDTLTAAIAASKAALEAQKTLLDYLIIRAPLRGRTGATSVDVGSNVRAADTTPLVTIVQTQPILAAFAVPQAELPGLKRALAARASAEVIVGGRVPQKRAGRLVFLDNQVDKSTGTVLAKVEVPNEDEFLWPGQAVEVALTVEIVKDKLILPASAVLPAQQGMIAWVVGADNRAEARTVALDRVIGQTAYLSGGLKPGETVITDGHVRVAVGAPVSIVDPNRRRPDAPGGGKEGKGDGGAQRPASPGGEDKANRSDRRS